MFLGVLNGMEPYSECDKCSYECYVFDRLVEMQVEIKQLKEDMRRLEDSVK